MDFNKLKVIIVFILAAFAALYLGVTAATAQIETVAWVVGTATLCTCFLLGRRIWLMIPFLGALQMTLMVPGRPTTLQVAEFLVTVFCVMMFLMRKLPFRLRFTELEVWILLLFACVLQVYLRNPAGIGLFGTDTVGGRPYIIFAISLLAAVILCGLQVPPQELQIAVKLSIIGSIVNLFAGIFGHFVPSLGRWYGAAAINDNPDKPVDPEQAGRIAILSASPPQLAAWVASYINPIRACLSPVWLPVVLASLALATLSGYRNVIAAVGLTYMVGIYYRGGWPALMASALISVPVLCVVAIVNLAIPLPPNVQRAMSFLPGTWEQRYVEDSNASTDWRMEIWIEVLRSDRWISNKIFGDGLGFTAKELLVQKSLSEQKHGNQIGITGFDTHRETILSNGDYHSGPVSAIRTIGYVGLVIMALAQLRLVVHAHRQINRCRGTPWFPVALFFCIPIVWTPIFFWLIYGGFAKDAPLLLMNAAMLRMLQNNLPLPAAEPVRRRYQPLVLREPLAPGRVIG